MHDSRGKSLKVGDLVLIPAVIVELSTSTDDYCNVSLETQIGRRPDGCKERICSINTGVLVKISSNDE